MTCLFTVLSLVLYSLLLVMLPKDYKFMYLIIQNNKIPQFALGETQDNAYLCILLGTQH